MLDTLISSRTRINLLLKFFLNPESTAYLRGLADEFKESTNAIRLELNRFEKAGMLESNMSGNRKLFKVNRKHPLFPDIRNLIFKFVGIDSIIENIVKKLGNPEKVYLTGDFARGRNGDIVDIIIIGNIDQEYLVRLINKVEVKIQKRIRYLVYNLDEFKKNGMNLNEMVLIWNK